MTRKDQVRDALAILTPAANEADACRKDIHAALDYIEAVVTQNEIEREAQSKRGRLVLNRFKKLLKDIQRIYARLPSIEQTLCEPLNAQIDKVLPLVTERASLPARSAARASHRQKACVREAHELLVKYGHKVRTTSGGYWDKLAAILYGDRDISLQRHLVTRRKKRSGR